ncbi:uncharacterized protein Dvir_GJ26517 [Drosophila virilis]|uniref:Uncharacterized protein n=1 Tax=Drosophila virilis TaxID=7244 RepID=A0A0Q9WEW6_DROVI|nr:uncharacterized protein Dvir_GJ26517 [Drosophila virilis]
MNVVNVNQNTGDFSLLTDAIHWTENYISWNCKKNREHFHCKLGKHFVYMEQQQPHSQSQSPSQSQ